VSRLLYTLGRLMQLAGLIVLPFAVSGNLSEQLSVSGMYQLTFVGIGLFVVGWTVQRMGKP
jgi:uncharacterized membrane protein YGL010W